MSDTASSGAPAAAPSEPLPASDSSTASAPVAPAPIGAFGTARGTGLARGKRPSQSAAPKAASSSPVSYKPTSIEVITPQSEYKNPFASEQPAAAAVPLPHPTPEAVTRPAFSFAPQPEADAGVTAPPVSFVQPTEPKAPVASAPAAELFPLDEPAARLAPVVREEMPELKILPPAESKRVAQSWENAPSQGAAPIFEPRARREERANAPAVGQPEQRRDQREPRQPRDPRDQKFDPREPRGDSARRDHRREQPRDPRDEQFTRTPVAAPQKSGGFFAWLKSLFSGPSATPATTTRDRDDRGHGGGHEHRDGEHRQHRRRHRGGRGRGGFQGQPRDPRDGPSEARSEGGQPRQGGEGRGYPQGGDGFPRRRSRGGRGRGRNRDDRGGDPRPEGTQGGGAI